MKSRRLFSPRRPVSKNALAFGSFGTGMGLLMVGMSYAAIYSPWGIRAWLEDAGRTGFSWPASLAGALVAVVGSVILIGSIKGIQPFEPPYFIKSPFWTAPKR